MTFIESIKACFGKYVTWQGRASRSEFWWFVLFNFAGSFILGLLGGIPGIIFSIVVFLPALAVFIRRLHDTNRSGWWYWIALVPIVGFILLIVWAATQGTDGDNDFGTDPLGGAGGDDDQGSSIPAVERD